MQKVAGILQNCGMVWIIGTDWQDPPSKLADTGWLQLVNGEVRATDWPTCGGRNIDYFVIHKGLKDAAGVAFFRELGEQYWGWQVCCAIMTSLSTYSANPCKSEQTLVTVYETLPN